MGFKPKQTDTHAPMGYRRFCCKSDTELQHAYGLIKKDYENCTIEQVLNMCVELHRRGQFNQLGGFLNWLGTLNSIPVGSQEEYRIVPG